MLARYEGSRREAPVQLQRHLRLLLPMLPALRLPLSHQQRMGHSEAPSLTCMVAQEVCDVM